MTSAAILPQCTGVLIASPNDILRERVRQNLPERDCRVQQASGGADALVKLETGDWQVVYLDRRLPDLDAEELMSTIRQRFPGIEVVMVDSDSGQDFGLPLRKRTAKLEVVTPVRPASPVRAEASPAGIEPLPGMIGDAPAMQRVYRLTRLVAPRTTTVLITGETGTGKELVARAIHELSPRAGRPFAVVNCAAIPEALLESELFGHVRGAFTGAVQSHVGRIQAAQGGTLFLDEIGEMPLSMQAKLLRFLEQKEVQRLGSCETVRVDVRVVAATNASLPQLVKQGKFRADLYFRLAAFPIAMPGLAERREDIIALAQHGLEKLADGGRVPALTADAMRLLQEQAWPGNVRELQYVMERALILAEGSAEIRAEHLYFGPAGDAPFGASDLDS